MFHNYLLVLGHPNFRSFSHSSQNANVSFNRLKSQFFDFLILVSLRTFRGMVYLFWSTPSGSSPQSHRARPRPPFPLRLEAGRAVAGPGAGWGGLTKTIYNCTTSIDLLQNVPSTGVQQSINCTCVDT